MQKKESPDFRFPEVGISAKVFKKVNDKQTTDYLNIFSS